MSREQRVAVSRVRPALAAGLLLAVAVLLCLPPVPWAGRAALAALPPLLAALLGLPARTTALLLAGVLAATFLPAPVSLLAAILLLWVLPLAVTGGGPRATESGE